MVSGGARGLGLVQAEALLEAGARGRRRIIPCNKTKRSLTDRFPVHAIDRLPPPSSDSQFTRVSERAITELGTSLDYHEVDVRDVQKLNSTVGAIASRHGRLDGLIAAAGIQQETPALSYTAEDVDKMMSVNVTGVFMTAQAVARQMVERKQGGSLVLIASMSGTVANRGLICP